MSESEVIRISVRNLVEFILREGDIDNRIRGSMDKDIMQQGSRIHRKIQRQMGSNYRAEIPLKIQVPCEGFLLQVEGRADGIMEEQGRIIIDEIKGVLRELNHIEEPLNVHLAQAKCYAYIYAGQGNLKEIGVQMTYCHLETEEVKRFSYVYPFPELEDWFINLVRQYEKWARFQTEWRAVRQESIKPVEFPFDYREGQHDIAASVYRTIHRKKKLFIQAPTGVGKTMATVFPAVKAVGEGLGEKVFYLTAKTITRTVAEQAFSTLKEQGLKFKVITLTAKEKICFCEETVCNPDHCPYAKGHYDRVNDAVFNMLTHSDDMSRESLEAQAKKYNVCPFEMSLDVSTWADAVICDYNYVFDPNAHLKRFFSEGSKGEYLFLIDEAHNLVERGREMYSAVLYKEDVLEMKRLVKPDAPGLAKRLDECNRQLLALKRECENYQVLDNVSYIAVKLMNIMSGIEEYLEKVQEEEKREQILNFYFQLRNFLSIHDILDENYVIYTEFERDGRFKLKLFCVNPAVNLRTYMDQGNSTVFFSATLLPMHYYKQLLSEAKDYAIYAPSSFPRENCLILLGTDVSSKYTMRGDTMYQKFSSYILNMVEAKRGNYMVFFPSYQFMKDVYEDFQKEIEAREDIDCIIQFQYMGEESREIFLESFEEDRGCSLVGFCVMGGIFSEGIDLTKDRLIGAAVVGTGLPQVCNDREILKQYFDKRGMSGFDYAYLYPGMNKVLQSAGRVIRTEEDKGIIALLDERFIQRKYREIFPREWERYRTCRLENFRENIEKFWEEKK
ncbi:ATP-dependent DNA helicase [Muricomes intestini]|uniref:ATP-dependent DNA helicase n=1 Tax=Muricomes intestini TaxID=1796634 RepID=UPI000E7DB9A1|nr:helicase [Lachnospiraceae bacterium]HCR81850.1 helicase [Lachnospiraceae bacterium]